MAKIPEMHRRIETLLDFLYLASADLAAEPQFLTTYN